MLGFFWSPETAVVTFSDTFTGIEGPHSAAFCLSGVLADNSSVNPGPLLRGMALVFVV